MDRAPSCPLGLELVDDGLAVLGAGPDRQLVAGARARDLARTGRARANSGSPERRGRAQNNFTGHGGARRPASTMGPRCPPGRTPGRGRRPDRPHRRAPDHHPLPCDLLGGGVVGPWLARSAARPARTLEGAASLVVDGRDGARTCPGSDQCGVLGTRAGLRAAVLRPGRRLGGVSALLLVVRLVVRPSLRLGSRKLLHSSAFSSFGGS